MVTKKRVVILIFALILLLIGAYLWNSTREKLDYYRLELRVPLVYDDYSEARSLLETAFTMHFFEGDLPVTNLKSFELENTASGKDILSESLGLLMMIAMEDNDQPRFDMYLEIMKRDFLKKNGLLKWRIQEAEEAFETVNASVDDLRVIKALFLASGKWHDLKYENLAYEMGETLYKLCVVDNQLKSFDDPNSPDAILTYYDFKAMLLLSEEQEQWQAVMMRGMKAAIAAQKNQMPLYVKEVSADEYKSIENLMVLLHFYEVGYEDSKSIAFIKEQILNGAYYNLYNGEGKAVGTIESPAVYGIIAQIAKLAGDKELYNLACDKMTYMQCPPSSQYYGAFVDEETHVGFSFDQLMALLGF